ncbi:hypothetical protein ILUMI_04538, partial [Ignelater luminosus]
NKRCGPGNSEDSYSRKSFPCNNHALNNALAKSSTVTVCHNATETMKKVVAFANSSAKRHDVFKDVLDGTSLQSICETRWVERHDGHLQFQGDTLQLISEAQKIAEQMDVELKIPETSSRQRHQDNHPAERAETVEEYFRRAVYIPLLDSIIFDLKDWLSTSVQFESVLATRVLNVGGPMETYRSGWPENSGFFARNRSDL